LRAEKQEKRIKRAALTGWRKDDEEQRRIEIGLTLPPSRPISWGISRQRGGFCSPSTKKRKANELQKFDPSRRTGKISSRKAKGRKKVSKSAALCARSVESKMKGSCGDWKKKG